MNFYDRHLGDYATATAHLSMLEHGAYNLLLDVYYAREKPFRDDLEWLCRCAHAATEADRSAVVVVAEEFFPVDPEDGMRHNHRADEEIAMRYAKSDKARQSARVRWRPVACQTQDQTQCDCDASAKRTHCVCDANGMLAVSRQPLDVLRQETPPLSPTTGERAPKEAAPPSTDSAVASRSKRATKRRQDAQVGTDQNPEPDELQVVGYSEDRGLPDYAAPFLAHYRAIGWVQGSGQPIVDWRAAYSGWCSREAKMQIERMTRKRDGPNAYSAPSGPKGGPPRKSLSEHLEGSARQ